MKFLCLRFINILFIEFREVFQYILSPLKVMYKYTLIYLAVFGGIRWSSVFWCLCWPEARCIILQTHQTFVPENGGLAFGWLKTGRRTLKF